MGLTGFLMPPTMSERVALLVTDAQKERLSNIQAKVAQEGLPLTEGDTAGIVRGMVLESVLEFELPAPILRYVLSSFEHISWLEVGRLTLESSAADPEVKS